MADGVSSNNPHSTKKEYPQMDYKFSGPFKLDQLLELQDEGVIQVHFRTVGKNEGYEETKGHTETRTFKVLDVNLLDGEEAIVAEKRIRELATAKDRAVIDDGLSEADGVQDEMPLEP